MRGGLRRGLRSFREQKQAWTCCDLRGVFVARSRKRESKGKLKCKLANPSPHESGFRAYPSPRFAGLRTSRQARRGGLRSA